MADLRTHRFSNNASCRLGEDVSIGETSIQLESGMGARFPTLAVGEIFTLTVENLQTGAREIMYATARSGDVVTVERGKEGTADQEWINTTSVIVQNRVTADTLEYLAATAGTSLNDLGDVDAPNPNVGDALVWNGTDWVNQDISSDIIIQLACSDLVSNLVSGDNKAYVRAPRAFTLTAVRASLLQAASGHSPVVIDIKKNGVSVLSTLLTIDEGETTSLTAATPVVIGTAAVANDDILSVQVVDARTDAKGLIVTLIGE
jgi:hypothetical protein